MAINRELSQFASFVGVDTNKNISIAATDGNKVGIGTTLPRQKLDVVGLSLFENTIVNGISTIGFVTATSGYIGVATVGVLTATSATIQNINVTGIITTPQLNILTSGGGPGPAIVGLVSATGLDVNGISTFRNSTGNHLVIGTATTDVFLSGKLNIRLASAVGGVTTTGLKGQVLLTDGEGNIGFGTASSFFANRIYVSEKAGDDTNDGSRLAVRTIKKAAQLASLKGEPTAIFVESGNYVEDNPIILYEDIAVIGDNVRNTIIRPQNPNQDLFRVRNGCYVTNFAIKDAVSAGVPQHTWNYAVAFDDVEDATTSRTGYAVTSFKPTITRSPYVQNCSIISFLGGNGVLVDGSKVNSVNTPTIPQEAENPVSGPQPEQGKSIVANAFTMVSFGGVGWRCINDGYAQVVSCFQIFCQDGSLTESGGYLSITNSATNFGNNALRSKGFSRNSFAFDGGIIAEHGISDVNQTLRVVGAGRKEQEQYILRFENAGQDVTNDFKPVGVAVTFDGVSGVNTTTDIITSPSHGLVNGNTVAYYPSGSGNIGGLSTVTQYYVQAVNSNTFKLFLDDSLVIPVNLTTTSAGIHTVRTKNLEFYASEIRSTSHNNYQRLVVTGGPYTFNTGKSLIQSVGGGNYAYGYVVNYDSGSGAVDISNEIYTGTTKYSFTPSGGTLLDHVGSPVTLSSVSGISTYYTTDIIVKSVPDGQLITNIGILTTGHRLNYHRPSIINSSSHTWEYAGSGTDYNALPQNGGVPIPAKEQVAEKGGQVYASGTNELGDFKIGNFITAKNRTGNITFTNTVTIGNLSALTLGVGGVTVGSISNDPDLGDNDAGGPSDSRLSTQLAQRSFLNNRLGYFIDKTASTNSVPNSVVVLNSSGKINSDLLPPATSSNFYYVFPGIAVTTRTTLVDDIPAKDLRNGDIVVENNGISTTSYQLFNDADSQYLVLSDSTRNYNFVNGDTVIGINENAIGIVTSPTSVGYGTSGFVKGVCLDLTISSGGSGYTAGIYTAVSIGSSTGIGTSARATVTVNSSNQVSNIDLVYGGRNYQIGDVLKIESGTIPQVAGTDASFQVSSVESRLYIDLSSSTKFDASTSVPNFTTDRDVVGLSTTLTVGYAVTFVSDTSVDTTNDRIVIGTHEFSNGDPVYYDNGGNVNIGGLTDNDVYFVKTVGISSIELHNNYHLNSLRDLSSVSVGIHSLTRKTVTVEDDAIVLLNHGYSTGDAVKVTGSVPTGLTTDSYYFVGSTTTNSFTLHTARSNALLSVGGTTFSPVNLTGTGTGIVTFTKQNVQFNDVINTSSVNPANYTVITASNIDASNIISGIINPDRLGSGVAGADTFLSGDSSYKKVASGIGVNTSQPLTLTGSAGFSGPSGGFTTYFGNVNISLDRANLSTGSGDDYGNLGVARYKKSNFVIGSDGAVRIKSTAEGGDVDAATLNGNNSSYYLNPANLSSTIPVNKGGTGLTTAIPAGGLLQADGSGFVITRTPNLNASGIGSITSTYFNGELVGVAQSLSNAANIVTGTINNDRLPTNINLTAGIVTSGRFIATDRIETASIVSTSSTITIDPGTIGDDTGTVRVRGNLIVDGSTTTINSVNLDISDKVVGISSAASPDDSTTADQSGIAVYGTTLKTLLYNNASTAWKSNQDFDLLSSKVYKVDGVSVLSSNTLGTGVTNSFLTSLGTLTNLGVSTTGIGTIPIADITTNLKTTQITEKANIVGSGLTGTYNYDLGSNGVVYYHTANSTGNWTPNFRWSSAVGLGAMVTTGQSVTVTVISSQNANFYSNSVNIDGTSGLTTRWSGGSAPTFGSTSGLDIYTYTLLRTGTGSSDWTILASRTQYA